MKTILLYGMLFFLTVMSYGQNIITLNGINVDINDIPLDRSYEIKQDLIFKSASNQKEKNLKQMVFASNNKKLFALSTKKALQDSDKILNKGYLGLYNKQGKLIWEYTEKNYYPVQCLINDEQNIIISNWGGFEEGNGKLQCFNQKGEVIFSDDAVEEIFPGRHKNIIYYTKDSYYTGNKENNYTLFCYDVNTQMKWKKNFSSIRKIQISSVSNDEKNLIIISDKIYSLNYKGDIKWQKSYDKYPGRFIISENGKLLLRLLDYKKAELYNNQTGELIHTFTSTKIDQFDFSPHHACFLTNDNNTIALCSGIAPLTSLIVYFEPNGDILGYNIVNDQALFMDLFIQNEKGVYSIFFDYKKVAEYEKEWK